MQRSSSRARFEQAYAKRLAGEPIVPEDLVGLSRYEKFILSRRSVVTMEEYHSWLPKILAPDPDAALELARVDRPRMEALLSDYILVKRQTVAPTSLVVWVSSVKSLFDYAEVQLSWGQIRSQIPKANFNARDRAPTLKEIQSMLEATNTRGRLVITALASSGGRIGVFHFPRGRQGGFEFLRLRDLELVDYSAKGRPSIDVLDWLQEEERPFVARARAYTEEAEEYRPHLSPEFVSHLRSYLLERRRVGELLVPDSPVVRDAWDWSQRKKGESEGARRERPHPEEAKLMDSDAIRMILSTAKERAGISSTSKTGGFKVAHGFRKWFDSNFPNCPDHGDRDKEYLMGHKVNYYRPEPEHVLDVYVGALGRLALGKAAAASFKLEKVETEQASKVEHLEYQLFKMREDKSKTEDRLAKLEEYAELLRERDVRRAEKGN